MRAITICQPYAHLIALPDDDPRMKRVENRTWSTPYRGPLLIHAGKSRERLELGELPDPKCDQCRGTGFVDCDTGVSVDITATYAAGGYVNASECCCGVDADSNYGIPLADLAFGAVVAVAELRDCVSVDRLAGGGLYVRRLARERWPWLEFHGHAEGPYCFVLTEVRALPEPIAWRGAQGLWTPPAELVGRVREQMEAAS